MPQSPEEALQIIASARFERMPDYRKSEYLEQVRRLIEDVPHGQRTELFERARTDESARQALRQVRHQAMVQRVVEFAKASPQDRPRLLDEALDEMEARRERRPDRTHRGDGPSHGNDGSHGSDDDRRARFRQHFQKRFEDGNPQINSLIGEYHRALRERRGRRGENRP